MANEEWEKQEGCENIWKPKEKGETLLGVVIRKNEGLYGMNYVVQTERGDEYLTPSYKVLQSRMSHIEEGDIVKIVFEGEELPKVKGHKNTMLFSVYKKKPETTTPDKVAVTEEKVI